MMSVFHLKETFNTKLNIQEEGKLLNFRLGAGVLILIYDFLGLMILSAWLLLTELRLTPVVAMPMMCSGSSIGFTTDCSTA